MIETLVRRLALGFGVAILGLAWGLGNDYYWHTEVAGRTGLSADAIIALPFYVLGIAAMLGRPRFIGTALTIVTLALFASVAYQWDARSTGSMAGLAFLLPLFYGTVLVVVAVVLQVLVDALRSRQTREFVGNLSESNQADWARFMSGHDEP